MRPTIGIFWLLLSSWLAKGQAPAATDRSAADADGPHVFFRGGEIVVRTLERTGGAPALRERRHARREDVLLTCSLPESGDVFEFKLKKQLQPDPCCYSEVERILVISDIEGNFEAYKRLLRAAGVIDDAFRWTYGRGHLVLLGDFFDRGLNVTEVLWLSYKLEDEAARAGGKVHYLLGNHEAMNLCGDHRYVRNKYPENARLLGEGYHHWYDENSELGRWLRTKNVIERIGPYVFCHGGISPAVAASGMSLEEINETSRRYLGVSFDHIKDPVAALVFHREEGLLWYRAAARGKMTSAEIEAALVFADAKHMVVGHTLMPEVSALYGGRLLCVDVLHEENLRNGNLHTLLIEHGEPYIIYNSGERKLLTPRPVLQHARGGGQ